MVLVQRRRPAVVREQDGEECPHDDDLFHSASAFARGRPEDC